MTYVGGLRARLIRDSVYRAVYDALADLGWFTPETSRADVAFPEEPVDINEPVSFNTIGLGDEDTDADPAELGSNLTIFTWPMFLDVYGENDSLSLHLVNDLAAILAGRLPSIGRSSPTVAVLDWTLATPTQIFVVDVEMVRTHRAHDFPQPWLRHWRSCSFRIVDTHGGEDG